MELADVMHALASAKDERDDQYVLVSRNGDVYTILIRRAAGKDYDFARRDCDLETAVKLYTKIAKAFVTGRGTWATRKKWIAERKNG